MQFIVRAYDGECLFSECAKICSEFVVSGLYRPLFEECEGDLDKFFNNIHKIDNENIITSFMCML